MSPSRREFIRAIGIALASLLLARCATPEDDQDGVEPTKEVEPTEVIMMCYEAGPPVTVEATPTTILQQTKVLTDVVDGQVIQAGTGIDGYGVVPVQYL